MLNVTSRVWGKDSWYQRHRFLFLMISLLAAIALSPLFDESRALYLFSDLFLTLVFLSGLWVVSQQRAWLLAGIALACPMLLSLWMSHVVDSSTMRVLVPARAFFSCSCWWLKFCGLFLLLVG